MTQLILALLLGVGLSASTGLNTFLPLLLLSGAARFDIVPLGTKFQWLSSDVAIIVLIVACVFEIVADKFPAVDHFLDVAGSFVRPVAGATAAASVLTGVDPTIAAIVGIIVGAPTSFGFHTLKAGTRVASSTTTFGCANPVISLIEDVLAFGLSVFAILAPITVPILVLLLAWVLWMIVKRLRVTSPAPSPAP